MPLANIGNIKSQGYTPRPVASGQGGTLTTATISGVTYNYHAFTTSGEFTATSQGFFEIVAVGGGGGGGMDNGAGGGAGELIHAPAYFLSSGTYAITIGGGGAGAPTSSGSSTGNPGSQGNPTIIENVFTAREGGGGASGQGTITSRKGGRSGGSGGGGQGENYASYYIYPGTGLGSKEDYGVSYLFDTSLSHYLTVANSNLFDFGTSTDFTISLWARWYSGGPTSGYVFSTVSGTTYYQLAFTADTTLGIKTLTFDVVTSGVSQTTVSFDQGFAPNSWNHIAITRSGTTYRLHINGKLKDEQTIADLAVDTGGGNLSVGNNWNGYLKDLHFISGEAVYSSDAFGVPDTYATAGSNTVLLMLLDATPTDYSEYNHTITENSSIRPYVTSFSSGSRYVGSPYSYPYSKITFKAAYEWPSGGYLRADGALSTLTSGTDPWTIECHAISSAVAVDDYLFGINTAASGGNVLLLGQDRLVAGSNYYYPHALNSPVWQHYAVTYDGTTIRVYIDGVLEVSVVRSFGALSTCVLGIGTEFDSANGGGAGNYWAGKMRNIRVVAGTALYTDDLGFTPPSVEDDLPEVPGTTLLAGVTGNIEDTSSAGTTVTQYGTIKASYNYAVATEKQSQLFSSRYNNYFRADGALASLTNTTDSWTLELFVQSDSDFMYSGYNGTTGSILFGFNSAAAGTNILVIGGDRIGYYNGTTDIANYTVKYTLTPEWTHMACTYDGTTFRMFFNGEKVLELDFALNSPLADCVFGIGAEFDSANGGTPGNYWYGRMRDLRFTPGVCVYRNNFNAPNPILDNLDPFPATSLLTFRDGVPEDISGNDTVVTTYSASLITDCFGQYQRRRQSGDYFRYGEDGGFAGPGGDDGGGGGGGAGRQGARATPDNGGAGGNGVYIDGFDSFGESGYFAGGGAGGNRNSGSGVTYGGLGGGGNGGVTGTNANGNTGGGGGASRISVAGRAGGSGVVIIRYPVSL